MADPALPYLRRIDDGVELDVVVVARASRSKIVGPLGERLKVALAAPPVDGAANAELLVTLAKALGVPKRTVRLVRGETNKHKTVRVADLDLASAARKLEGSGS